MTVVARSRREVVALLHDVGIIPVIRAGAPEVAVRVAEALADAALPIAEITMTVPDAVRAIAAAAQRLGERVLIGAGTVTDARSAQAAIDAGASFIVSPCVMRVVIDVARRNDVAVLPGALTPTEILQAVRFGADLVKIFPVTCVGGASYIRALRGPFPDVPLVPTGGVSLQTLADYIRAGSSAVGVGSELISREALQRGDYATIGTLARQFVQAVRTARSRG